MSGLNLRPLGQTNLSISPIGLGCWQFAGGGVSAGFWRSPPQDEINRILAASLAGGVNWFDTAEIYGFGRSERALSIGLQVAGRKDGEAVVATKWSPFFRTSGSLRESISARERFLAPYHVDLYQIHQPYALASVKGQMDALADLLEAGRIKAAGVSNFSALQTRQSAAALKARGYPLASNQVKYSLLDRRIERDGTLQAARDLGVTIIAYSPLAQGLLSDRYLEHPELIGRLPFVRRRTLGGMVRRSRDLVQALADIGRGYHATAAQVALNWLVSFHGQTVVAIPGATRVAQAEQNAGAMGFTLSKSEMQKLDELSRAF
jgi:aryl-alcohol dehydrogenase-like predicted oxidoreductase